MAIANMKASFISDIAKIWKIVTSCEDYEWRSDLSKIEVVEQGKRFVEYTNDGYPTKFTITAFQPYKRYEFDMENQNIKGHWIGIFKSKDQLTEVEFIEEVTAKKIYLKPFIKGYLKKQQKQYITDLKRKLGEL